jgi:biotin carboxyl carrier protein
MFTGEQRIIQEGQTGEAEVLSRVVKRCGVTIASTDLNAVTTTEATPLIVGMGTQPKPELPEGCLFLWPVRGSISSDYGYRFIFGETNFHRGIDIPAPTGTAINAAADGVVTFAGERGTYGNLVVLTHANGFQTYYAHCSQLLVHVGETVTQGQPVAAVGSTGRSTGPHVHFEVRYQNAPIDPLLYLPGANNAPAREEVTEEEEEEIEDPAPAPAPVKAAPANGEKVLSPFPGLIKNLLVAEGASVKKDQPILVLEAMKMDNDITAPCDGVVSFQVTKGANVESDSVLAVIS